MFLIKKPPTRSAPVGSLLVPGRDQESPTCSCRCVKGIPGRVEMPLGVDGQHGGAFWIVDGVADMGRSQGKSKKELERVKYPDT